MAKKPDRISKLEKLVEKLSARVTTLENKETSVENTSPAIAASDIDLTEMLSCRKGYPYQEGENRGAILYAGAVERGGAEYLWQREFAFPGVLSADVDNICSVLSVLASPIRLKLVRYLLSGPKSSQALQEFLQISSAGQLYHHLKELVSEGIVQQRPRGEYRLTTRHAIPLLVMMCAALDIKQSKKATSSSQ